MKIEVEMFCWSLDKINKKVIPAYKRMRVKDLQEYEEIKAGNDTGKKEMYKFLKNHSEYKLEEETNVQKEI